MRAVGEDGFLEVPVNGIADAASGELPLSPVCASLSLTFLGHTSPPLEGVLAALADTVVPGTLQVMGRPASRCRRRCRAGRCGRRARSSHESAGRGRICRSW